MTLIIITIPERILQWLDKVEQLTDKWMLNTIIALLRVLAKITGGTLTINNREV